MDNPTLQDLIDAGNMELLTRPRVQRADATMGTNTPEAATPAMGPQPQPTVAPLPQQAPSTLTSIREDVGRNRSTSYEPSTLDRIEADAVGLEKEKQNRWEELGFPADEYQARMIADAVEAVGKAGGDPLAELERWKAAGSYATWLGKDLRDAYVNLDSYQQAFFSRKFAGTSDLKAIQNAGRIAFLNNQINYLGKKLREAGGKDARAEVMIKDATAEVEQIVAQNAAVLPSHWLTNFLSNAIQSVPYTAESTIRTLGKVAMAGPVLGGLALAGGAAAESAGVATAAVDTARALSFVQSISSQMGGFQVGTDLMSGTEYVKLRAAGVTHELAAPLSDVSAGFQAAVETALGNIAGLVPRLGGSAAQSLTGRVIEKLFVRGRIGSAARRLMEYGLEIPEEGAEEAIQDIGSNAALELAALLQKEGVDVPTAQEVAQSARDNFVAGMQASVLLGIPGSVIGYRGNLKEIRTLREQAKLTDRKAFVASNQGADILDGLDEAGKQRALERIWDAQNAKTAAKQEEEKRKAPAAEPPASPGAIAATLDQKIESAQKKVAELTPEAATKTKEFAAAQAELDMLVEQREAVEPEVSAAPQKPSELTREEWLKQKAETEAQTKPQEPAATQKAPPEATPVLVETPPKPTEQAPATPEAPATSAAPPRTTSFLIDEAKRAGHYDKVVEALQAGATDVFNIADEVGTTPEVVAAIRAEVMPKETKPAEVDYAQEDDPKPGDIAGDDLEILSVKRTGKGEKLSITFRNAEGQESTVTGSEAEVLKRSVVDNRKEQERVDAGIPEERRKGTAPTMTQAEYLASRGQPEGLSYEYGSGPAAEWRAVQAEYLGKVYRREIINPDAIPADVGPERRKSATKTEEATAPKEAPAPQEAAAASNEAKVLDILLAAAKLHVNEIANPEIRKTVVKGIELWEAQKDRQPFVSWRQHHQVASRLRGAMLSGGGFGRAGEIVWESPAGTVRYVHNISSGKYTRTEYSPRSRATWESLPERQKQEIAELNGGEPLYEDASTTKEAQPAPPQEASPPSTPPPLPTEPMPEEKKPEPEVTGPKKSVGHVMFVWKDRDQYEVYTSEDGDLYLAPVSSSIDLDSGRREGRFYASKASASTAMARLAEETTLEPAPIPEEPAPDVTPQEVRMGESIQGVQVSKTGMVAISSIATDRKDVEQFKGDVPTEELDLTEVDNPKLGQVNPVTGEVYGQEILDFRQSEAAPITLWERKDGALVVVTGRHRLQGAIRAGKTEILAQIVREADGFTMEMALAHDAESNILQGKGSVRDYVRYFTNVRGVSESYARETGLLRQAKGYQGFGIARYAEEGLRSAWAAGNIPSDKAAAIAWGAPGNDPVQRVVSAQASGKRAAALRTAAQLLVQYGSEGVDQAQQGELEGIGGGSDYVEQLIKLGLDVEKYLSELKGKIASIKSALSDIAGRRAKKLTKYNLSGDEISLRNDLESLQAELESWEEWTVHPWKMRRAREMFGLPVKELSEQEELEYQTWLDSSKRQEAGTPGGDQQEDLFGGRAEDNRYDLELVADREANYYRKTDEEVKARLASVMADAREAGVSATVVYRDSYIIIRNVGDGHTISNFHGFLQMMDGVRKIADETSRFVVFSMPSDVWQTAGKKFTTLFTKTYQFEARKTGTRKVKDIRLIRVPKLEMEIVLEDPAAAKAASAALARDRSADWSFVDAVERLPGPPPGSDSWITGKLVKTTDPSKATYILKDGTMVTFDGVDYDTAMAAIPKHARDIQAESIDWFMRKSGAVRFNLKDGVVNFATKPTREQADVIGVALEGSPEAYVEITNTSGQSVAATKITSPTPDDMSRVLLGARDPGYRSEDEAAFGKERKQDQRLELDWSDSVDLREDSRDPLSWVENTKGRSAVADTWEARKRVDYRGQKVGSIKDLATLWSIFRSQTIETFHFVFVRQGVVLGHHAITSQMSGSVSLFTVPNRFREYYKLRRAAEKLGADSVYLVHNHPSGNTTASDNDKIVTREMENPRYGIGELLKGHIILNGSKFAFLSRGSERKADYTPVSNFDASRAVIDRNPIVRDFDDIAAVTKALLRTETRSAIVFIGAGNRVVSWEPLGAAPRLNMQTLHQKTREYGARGYYIITDSKIGYGKMARAVGLAQMRDLGKNVDVLNIYHMNPTTGTALSGAVQDGLIGKLLRHDDWKFRQTGGMGMRVFDPQMEDYQSSLFVDEHEESVFNDVIQNQWVPDKVLADYAHRDWAQREIARRESLRDEAQASKEASIFEDDAQYADIMAATSIDGTPRDYFRRIYRSSDAGLDPEKAGRRFLESFTKAQAEVVLHDLGREDYLDNDDEDARARIEAALATLPAEVKSAVAEIREKGELTEETYQKVLGEVKKDPGAYRLTLSGALSSISAGFGLLEKMEEAEVDPDTATTEELKRAYHDKAATVEVLKGTIGDILKNEQRLSQAVTEGEQELAERKAAQQAKQYIQRLVSNIMRPVSAAVAQGQRKQIVELQDSMIVRGAKTMRAVKEAIAAQLKRDPKATISGMAERILKIRDLEQMSMAELEQLSEKVKELRYVGAMLRKMDLVERHHRQWQTARGVLANIKSTKGRKKPPTIGGSVEFNAMQRGSAKERAAWWVLRPNRWAQILDGGEEGVNYKTLIDRANIAENEWARNEDRRSEAVASKLKELGLKQSDFLKVVTVDGERLTLSDALGAYIFSKNEDSQAAVLYGNFKGNTDKLDELLSHLTPQMEELGDFMLESFQGNDRDRLIAFVENHLNKAFVEVENYFPMMRQDVTYRSLSGSLEDEMLSRSGVMNAFPQRQFIKSRVKIAPENQTRIRLNAMAIYFDAIGKQERLMAYQPLVEDLYAIYGRRDIREAIAQHFGGQANETIRRYIQNIANPDFLHYMDNPVDRQWNTIRGNLQMSALTWNIMTAARNHPLVGSWLYLRDAGPFHLLSGLAQIYTNRKAVEAFVFKRDPQVKTRTQDPFLWRLKQTQKVGFANPIQRVGWVGLRLLEHFDKLTVLSGWKACYDMMIATGHSDQEATQYAQRATLETQPTGNVKDQSLFLQSNAGKFLALFGNQLSNMLNMMVYDLPQDVKRKRIDRILGMVVGFAMTGILMGIIQRKRFPDEPEELALDVASQFLSPTVIGDGIVTMATGKGYYGSGAPWSNLVRRGYLAGKTLFDSQAEVEKKAQQVIRVLPEALRLAGAPSVAMSRAVDAIMQGDPWELLGGAPEAPSEE